MGMSVGSVFRKPINRPPQKSTRLCNDWAKVGIEVEMEECPNPTHIPGWDFKGDGSLRNRGIEFVTVDGLRGLQLEEAVHALLHEARTKGWSEAEPRAAIHIHLDVTDLGEVHDQQLANLLAAYMLFEHAFFGFAGEWRRWCGFCDAVEDSRAELTSWASILYGSRDPDTFAMHVDRVSKYQALNLRPMQQFGTVEFRHLPTTFEDARLLTWINFILRLKNFADTTEENVDFLKMAASSNMQEIGRLVFSEHWGELSVYANQEKWMRALSSLFVMRKMNNSLGKFDKHCRHVKITNKLLLAKIPKGAKEAEVDDAEPFQRVDPDENIGRPPDEHEVARNQFEQAMHVDPRPDAEGIRWRLGPEGIERVPDRGFIHVQRGAGGINPRMELAELERMFGVPQENR